MESALSSTNRSTRRPFDEVRFVGLSLVLDGQKGWQALASALHSALQPLNSWPTMQISLRLATEKPGRTEERKFHAQSQRNAVEEAIREVAEGRVISLRARTHRGEWESSRKGHWLWCGPGSPFDAGWIDPEVSLLLTFPCHLFDAGSPAGVESVGRLVTEIADRMPFVYGYGNLGRWDNHPGTHGIDRLYAETAHAIPVSAFDDYIGSSRRREYRHGVKGAFWLNILNSYHVEALGGVERFRFKAQPYEIDQLAHGGIMVLVTPSPLVQHTTENRQAFARLFKALEPVFG